ncbi:GNAT family N-acetyltransferase [Alphaproteobacteria bacterium]|nr:GNAT family N-acetyltransferase [Alphaproteobacteria bacterium]
MNINSKILAILCLGTISIFHVAASSAEENIGPSKPGKPLKQTFFRRAKARSPVFLQAIESVGPSRNFRICLHAAAPDEIELSPEGPDKTESKRKFFQDEKHCPTLGLISAEIRGESFNITAFMVCKANRKKGYGTHAILTLMSLYKKKGAFKHFTLSFRNDEDDGPQLRRLYKRIGFQEDTRAELFGGFFVNMFLPREEFNPNKPGIFKS